MAIILSIMAKPATSHVLRIILAIHQSTVVIPSIHPLKRRSLNAVCSFWTKNLFLDERSASLFGSTIYTEYKFKNINKSQFEIAQSLLMDATYQCLGLQRTSDNQDIVTVLSVQNYTTLQV